MEATIYNNINKSVIVIVLRAEYNNIINWKVNISLVTRFLWLINPIELKKIFHYVYVYGRPRKSRKECYPSYFITYDMKL